MRLLADEGLHRIVVMRLREAGFVVEWVRESARGMPDAQILSRSDIGDLVLITNDRDYGELIFNKGLPRPCSILYSRLPHRLYDLTANRLIACLEGGVAPNQLLTITMDGERAKPFPIGA